MSCGDININMFDDNTHVDLTSPKMDIQFYFNFFRIYLNVLESFKYRRGDLYTADV